MPHVSLEDQAIGLRRMSQTHPVRVIAVTSGKGGVGKTNVSVNLAVSMAQAGREVMLLDADLGLANVDIMLGLKPMVNLSNVLNGECGLEDVLIKGPAGVNIVPASSGVASMANLDPAEHAGIIRAFSELSLPVDVLIVDTAAGLARDVVSFCRAAQDIIVVVCDEPASITDAYALIKVLSRESGIGRFRILANMARSPEAGRQIFHRLTAVCDRFLDVTLDYMGRVPFDEYLRKAVQHQRAVVDAYPGSAAARAFRELAHVPDKWPIPNGPSGHIEFFVERLLLRSDD